MIPLKSVILISVATFCAGAGISWLVLQPHLVGNKALQQPPTYIIQAPAGSEESAPAAMQPPDVSQLPPADAAVTLGNWNYDQKNWQQSIECYQRAISLGTDNPDVRTDLGNAFRFNGEPKKALEQYQAAQRENPQHENSLYNMATLYEEVLGDRASALRSWQEYLTRFPNGEKAALAKQFITEPGTKTGGAIQP